MPIALHHNLCCFLAFCPSKSENTSRYFLLTHSTIISKILQKNHRWARGATHHFLCCACCDTSHLGHVVGTVLPVIGSHDGYNYPNCLLMFLPHLCNRMLPSPSPGPRKTSSELSADIAQPTPNATRIHQPCLFLLGKILFLIRIIHRKRCWQFFTQIFC